ncbi:MAG TPA: alpha/beta hydrolase [Gaiellaceae bacterium]|nr:alpha/beta hydrolase [Gaiellaceae bacterium]
MGGRTATAGWTLRERADLAGGRVAWDCLGDGPPVVLVHGTPGWSYAWRTVAPRLAERFTVHLLDLVGYGDSERRESQDMSVAAQGRALAELLDRWGLERPALVGHDVGAAIVLRAHLLEGRPASAVALLDAAVLLPWNTPATLHMKEHLDAYRTMPAHVYEHVVAAHLATAFHRPLAPGTMAGYLRPWQGEDGQAAYFRKIAQWRDDDLAVLEPLLGTIDVPALVLWGAEDRWLAPELAGRLAASIPGARTALIPDAGHFVMEDAPEVAAAELLRFLGCAGTAAA